MDHHYILCGEYVSNKAIRYYQFIPCIFAAGDKSIEVHQVYSNKRAGDLEGTDKINSTRQLIRDSTESIYMYGDCNRCTCVTSDQFSDQRTETDRDSWNCDIGEITTAKINGYATRLLPYHLKFFRLRTSFSQYNKSKEAKVILNVLRMQFSHHRKRITVTNVLIRSITSQPRRSTQIKDKTEGGNRFDLVECGIILEVVLAITIYTGYKVGNQGPNIDEH